MPSAHEAPPSMRRFKARVRLGARTDFGETPPWEQVEAYTAAEAACVVVARGQRGTTFAGGRLPVEVAAYGTAAVQRFNVEYSIKYDAQPASEETD